MSATNLVDLLGHPMAPPQPAAAKQVRRRPQSEEARRKKLLRHLDGSNNLMLFDELLDFLKAPLLRGLQIPAEYVSDIGEVAVVEVDCDDEERADSVQLPYEAAWGKAWVEDRKGFGWSKEGLLLWQVRLFWRSLQELGLANNEREKWSSLRWIFRPAIWKYYAYDKRIGRSHCLEVHERDELFSFHNCCIAARMDADAVREGVRRNVPAEVIKAVERVCKFD